MEVNLGINMGETLTAINNIFAAIPNLDMNTVVSVSGSDDWILSRGALIKKDTGQEYVPIVDKSELDIDDPVGVALAEVKLKTTGVKVPIATIGKFIKEALTPDDVPVGVYGNIIIESQTNL